MVVEGLESAACEDHDEIVLEINVVVNLGLLPDTGVE